MKVDILCGRVAPFARGGLKAKLNLWALSILLLGLAFTEVYLPSRASAEPAKVPAYPMDLIASQGWYITLPTKIRATPDTVNVGGSPDLMTYTDEWFRLNETKDGVVFKARTDGAHTTNSSNPRSELREMSNDGKNQAAWSSTSGTHAMELEQTVNVLPIGSKPVVVVGQIHDANDDVSVFRLEGNTSGDRNIGSLWITDGDSAHGYLLTNSYRLGTKFRVGFNVSGGKIAYTYNGQPVAGYTQSKSFSGAYFKAGSYNQSGGNCTKLTSGPDAGKCDYAEVTIYRVQVCHNGACTGNAPGSTPPVPTNTPVSPSATPAPTGTATAAPTPTSQPSTPGPTPVPPTTFDPHNAVIYLSASDGGQVGNVRFKDEDIVAFEVAANQWRLYFDGSAVGLSSADVDAFALLPDGSLLFSFITQTDVPGVGKVDDSDIVRFVPTALGANTAGSFQLYFDGSDVDLTEDGEDIDALTVLKDGRLLISTTGGYKVAALSGDRQDLLAFTPRRLGAETAGDWTLYLKGADVGLTKSSENVAGVWLNEAGPNGADLYLSTSGNYAVDQLAGDHNDIFACNRGATCSFQRFWDGGQHSFGDETIDAFAITSGFIDANIVTAADTAADDGGAEDDSEPTEESSASDESADAYQIFLPVIANQ
ncbi:MAG: polysaccharide lyase family 7 protein [Chloroflexi bacterium]|nr:polysaccharide lyase family 7 protein [Chloroflexota bacterium]